MSLNSNFPQPCRAFFMECSGGHWLCIMQQLSDRFGWNPVLWTGAATDFDAVQQAYPGIAAQIGVRAARGIPASGLADVSSPVDAQLLEGLAAHETIAVAMMDRMDPTGFAFTYEERRRHYLDLLAHWEAVLTKLAPDVVVFSMSPHAVYDYVLYALCEARGIVTLMFERTGAPGYLYIQSRFEEGSAKLAAEYKNRLQSGHFTLPPDLEAYLARQTGSARSAAPNFARKIERFSLNKSGSAALVAETMREVHRFAYLALGRGRAPDNYLKVPGRPPNDEPSLLFWQRMRLEGIRRKRRLKTLVNRMSTETIAEPYVFVPLHFQPERATLPSAGLLFDQTHMVQLLAHAAPNGWTIAIKEHPWQLSTYSRGEIGRSEQFYARLARLPNVKLLPIEASTDRFMERASAVATMTGSVGWQAICRGIPTLVFGAAWYRDVDGAYCARSIGDLRSAFKQIVSGIKPDRRAPAALLAAIADVGVRGVLEPSIEDVGDLDMRSAAINMAAALSQSWRELKT